MLIKDFVRQLNPQILTEYCKHKNIPFTTPKNKKSEKIATAFVKCLEKIGMENKGKVELNFQDIDVIANERGSLMLAEYGKNLFASLPQALQEDMNAYDKALWAFIKEEALFDKVSTEYVIEYASGWTAFHVKPCSIEDVLDKEEELGNAVGRYFRETEQRAESWIELTEKAFTFALYAREHFINGEIEKKKTILSALGSNQTLKDKKFSIQANLWLQPIIDGYPPLEEKYRRIDTTIFSEDKRKSEAFASLIPGLQARGESNPRRRFWRPPYYHYTTRPCNTTGMPVAGV